MGYDRGDSFPSDFEPNGNPFGSKSEGKLSPRSYPIQFERKSNTSFFSVDIQGNRNLFPQPSERLAPGAQLRALLKPLGTILEFHGGRGF